MLQTFRPQAVQSQRCWRRLCTYPGVLGRMDRRPAEPRWQRLDLFAFKRSRMVLQNRTAMQKPSDSELQRGRRRAAWPPVQSWPVEDGFQKAKGMRMTFLKPGWSCVCCDEMCFLAFLPSSGYCKLILLSRSVKFVLYIVSQCSNLRLRSLASIP